MNLISFSDLAEMLGISRAAITKAAKKNNLLLGAVIDGKIDLNNPVAVRYIAKKTKKENTPSISVENVKKEIPTINEIETVNIEEVENKEEDLEGLKVNIIKEEPQINIDYDRDVSNYMDIPIREILNKFGSTVKFIEFLKASQIISAVKEKNLKNAVLEGQLVSRDSVQKNFFDPVNAAHLKLMSDGAKNLTQTIKAKVLAGVSDPEIEKIASGIVASFIKPVKSKMTRALKAYNNKGSNVV